MSKQRDLKPSEFDKKYAKAEEKGQGVNEKLIDQIPDSEKMRLFKESGILDKLTQKESEKKGELPDFTQPPPDDFIFDAIVYSIPFTTFYSIMELLIYKQYNEKFDLWDLSKTYMRIFPVLLFFIYITNKHRHNKYVKMAILIAGLACGIKLMKLLRDRVTLGEMKASAGLSTLWAYTAFQLDFVPCLISVVIPGLYYFYLK